MQSEDAVHTDSVPKLKHSEFGIGASVAAIANVVGLMLCYGLRAALQRSAHPVNQGISWLYWLALFAVFLFSSLGMLTGLIGSFQPRRRKTFAFIGLIINAVLVCSAARVIIPGLLDF